MNDDYLTRRLQGVGVRSSGGNVGKMVQYCHAKRAGKGKLSIGIGRLARGEVRRREFAAFAERMVKAKLSLKESLAALAAARKMNVFST